MIIRDNTFKKHCHKALLTLCITCIFIVGCRQQASTSTDSISGIVQLNTTQLEYEIYGAGEPLVIIHGGPGLEYSYFMPGIMDLAKDYQLIFYHQRGTGKSVGLIDSTTLTIDQFVRDLEDLRVHLKLDKMNLLGHSWGGVLALNYTLQYPERVKSQILVSSVGMDASSLTALGENMAGRTTPEIAEALGLITASHGFSRGDSSALNDYLAQVFKTYLSDPRLASTLPVKIGPYSSSNFFATYTGLIINQLADYDIQARLIEIKCPTLFIHGEDDPMPIEMLEEMQQNIKGSSFTRIPKCGHFPFAESPKLVNQVIQKYLADN